MSKGKPLGMKAYGQEGSYSQRILQYYLERAIQRYVVIDIETGCWIWQGCKRKHGYGGISVAGRLQPAHRVIFELIKGEILPGLILHHKCGMPACVNPEHLKPITPAVHAMMADTPFRRNQQNTHCPQGHPRTSENTLVRVNGKRECLICNRDRANRRRRIYHEPEHKSACCVHGHEYTPENTYTSPDGSRQCRICRADSMRRFYERKRQAARNT